MTNRKGSSSGLILLAVLLAVIAFVIFAFRHAHQRDAECTIDIRDVEPVSNGWCHCEKNEGAACKCGGNDCRCGMEEADKNEEREEREGKCEIAEARDERDELATELAECKTARDQYSRLWQEEQGLTIMFRSDLAEAQRERTAVNAGFVACEHKQRELRDRLEESERLVIELKHQISERIDKEIALSDLVRKLESANKALRTELANRPRCECGDCEPRHRRHRR